MVKLKEAVLVNFGKFKNKSFVFADGLQVFYGLNEAGKSTLELFIKVMLYGMPQQRKSAGILRDRDRAIPWGEKNAEGILKLENDGREIEIYRRFGKTAAGDKTETVDSLSGEIIPEFCITDVGKKLFGISENIFIKSFWISQESVFPSGRDEEISKRLMKLCDTGDEEVSAVRTLERLEAVKRGIRAKDKRGTPGKLDILRKAKEEKTEEKYRAVTELRQREAAERKLIELKKRLAAADVEIEKLAEDEQNRINILKLEEKAKKWAQAQELRKKAEECNRDRTYLKYKELTDEEIYTAEKSENCINTIDQSEIKGYDITEKNAKQPKYGRMFMIIGAVAVVAACILLCFGLPLPAAVGVCIAGAALAVTGLCLALKEREAELAAEAKKAEYEKRVNAANAEKDENRRVLDGILNKYGCESVAELKKHREYCRGLHAEAEKLICAYNAVLYGESREELEKAARDMALLDDDTLLCRDVSAEIREKRKLQAELQQEIMNLNQNGAYVVGKMRNPADLEAELNALDKDIAEQEDLLAAAEEAEEVFKTVYERRKSDFTPILNKTANFYLNRLTCGRYNDMRVSDEYKVRISPDGTGLYDSEYFSRGTSGQIYFALRLALGELTANGDEPMFIDDMLTPYDGARAEAAFDLICEISKKRQVILFTCHERDVDTAMRHGAVIYRLEEQ